MIPRLKPYLGLRELMAALTPKSGQIERFESAFAQKFGCQYGTMFSHGRSGLYGLMKAWNLHQAEVIVPAYTCVVVQHAIVLSDNIPVFVDCAEDSPNMDYEGIRAAITEKTRCVVVTHLFGVPMNVHRVAEIVAQAEQKYGHKIYVIQDVAHSYGCRWDGQLVTEVGDAALFGVNISKIMTSVFGGMITTNSQETDEALKAWRRATCKPVGVGKSFKRLLYLVAVMVAFNQIVYSIVNWMERKGLLDAFTQYYDEGKIDLPADWDQMPCELEARVGLVQLSKYDEIIKLRQRISLRYLKHLEQIEGGNPFPHISGSTYSHFAVRVANRDKWVEAYRQQGIQLGILVEYSVPEMTAYQSYKRGEYPRAAWYSEHMINLPNWPGIAEIPVFDAS